MAKSKKNDSVFGAMFDGPDSVFGKLFGDSKVNLPTKVIRLKLKPLQKAQLERDSLVTYRVGDTIIRLELVDDEEER